MSVSQVSVWLSGQGGTSWVQLLPHLAGVVVDAAEVAGGRVCIWVHARADHGVPGRPAVGAG